MDDQALRAVAEIAMNPMLQQLILCGKFDCARRFLQAADHEAVPVSSDELEAIRGFRTFSFVAPADSPDSPTSLCKTFG